MDAAKQEVPNCFQRQSNRDEIPFRHSLLRVTALAIRSSRIFFHDTISEAHIVVAFVLYDANAGIVCIWWAQFSIRDVRWVSPSCEAATAWPTEELTEGDDTGTLGRKGCQAATKL